MNGPSHGLVLCGGRSRRMGAPKAWLPFGDELLLPRIVRTLGAAVDSVTVVAAPGQELPVLPPRVALVRDAEEGCGPLAGLAAGASAVRSAAAIFLTSCDVPFLRPQLVRRVLGLLGSHDIAIPVFENRPQPLAAAYRIEGLLPHIERIRAGGKTGLIDLLPDADVRFIAPEELREADPELDSLRNINTPQEYDEALRMLNAPRSL